MYNGKNMDESERTRAMLEKMLVEGAFHDEIEAIDAIPTVSVAEESDASEISSATTGLTPEEVEKNKKAIEDTLTLFKGVSEDIVRDADPNAEDKRPTGSRDFYLLNLSQGFPIFNTFVREMIRHGSASEREKKRMLKSLDKSAKKYGGGVGGRRVDFIDEDDKRRHCIIFMGPAKQGYDMTDEINKYKNVANEASHDKFIDAIQDLMNFARHMYGGLIMKEECRLFEWVTNYLPDDVKKECYGIPKIDELESTFFIRKEWMHAGTIVEVVDKEVSD